MSCILLLAVHGEYSENIARNIGVQRLAYYLERHGIDCDTCEIGLDDPAPFLKKAELGAYKIIGVSCTYNCMEQELEAVAPFYEAKKSHPILFAAGGQCPSSFEELWLDVGFDIVMRGYGEKTMLALAEAVQKNGACIDAFLCVIPGLSFKMNGSVVKVPQAPLSEDDFFDFNYNSEMALVDKRVLTQSIWSLVLERYRDDGDFSSINIYTSHHCPNRCGYCCSSSFLESSYGMKGGFCLDADSVLDIVCEYSKRRNVKNIMFADDEFCFPKKRFRSFCEGVIEAKQQGKLPHDISFQCQTRVLDFSKLDAEGKRCPDAELIELVSKAGFNIISLGVENFSKRLLRTPLMNKRGFSAELVLAIVDKLLNLNICPNVNFMMCVPEAKPEEIYFNVSMLMEMQRLQVATNLNVHIYAFPGARAFDDEQYEAITYSLTSPLNGTAYTMKGHFIPQHPDVRNALEFYLERGVKEEIAALVELMGDEFFYRDTYLLNLLKCRSLCRKLPDNVDIIQKLGIAIDKRLSELGD